MKTKNICAILIAILLPFALSVPCRAQENETPNGRLGGGGTVGGNLLEKPVSSIRMKGVSLATFLSVVSSQTGVAFTIAEDVADSQVTVFLRKSSLGEVMELLRKTKDLEFRSPWADGAYSVSRSTTPFDGFPPLTRTDIEDPLLQRVVEGVRVSEAPLNVFLDIVSVKAKINFVVVGDAQEIFITTFMKKTTVADILLFLRGKGISYSRVGNSNTFVIRRLESASDNFAKAEKAYKDRKYEEAIALYRKVAETFPDSEMADNALLMAAVNYDWIAARDNDPSAIREEEKLLNSLITGYPKSSRLGDAYLYLGQIYSGNGGVAMPVDCAKAVKYFELAIENTYRDWIKAQAGVRIAQCYEREGKKKKSEAIYRDIVEKYPNTPIAKELRVRAESEDPILATGASLEEKGLYKLAISIYEARWDGSTEESVRKAELRIGICQAAMKDADAAIKTFDAYLAKYEPALGDEAYSQMAQALKKIGRRADARKYLEKGGDVESGR